MSSPLTASQLYPEFARATELRKEAEGRAKLVKFVWMGCVDGAWWEVKDASTGTHLGELTLDIIGVGHKFRQSRHAAISDAARAEIETFAKEVERLGL